MVENILFRIFCIYMVILGDFGVSAIFGETHIVLRLHLNNPHTHTQTHTNDIQSKRTLKNLSSKFTNFR